MPMVNKTQRESAGALLLAGQLRNAVFIYELVRAAAAAAAAGSCNIGAAVQNDLNGG